MNSTLHRQPKRTEEMSERIIFLISQPRAGSTLTQRILGQHPAIHTTGEPWLMLHPVYALRSVGHTADYEASLAHEALQQFLDGINDGHDTYIQGLRRFAYTLYDAATTQHGARYFLDKTPRYYRIIPELYQIFPKAKFIILLRNPLAVLASILRTWVGRGWYSLRRYRADLLLAPQLLANALDGVPGSITLRYEDIVSSPRSTMEALCVRLGIQFHSEILNYDSSERWAFGDQRTLYHRTAPDAAGLQGWLELAETDGQAWRLLSDYLEAVGPRTMSRLGYDHSSLRAQLDRCRPPRRSLLFTQSLAELTKPREPSLVDRSRVFSQNALRSGSLRTAVRFTMDAVERRTRSGKT